MPETRDIVRCPDCGHGEFQHGVVRSPRVWSCCFGWCKCTRLRREVVADGEPDTITVWPAYDQATGRWAS